MDRTLEIEIPINVSCHKGIAAFSALDFPSHPRMTGLPRRLIVLVRYDFLPHLKPQLGRDEALAGGQNQHLALQILVLAFRTSLTAIIVAAIGPYKVGGIVINLRSLTFEKLVNVQVSHCVNWIAEN